MSRSELAALETAAPETAAPEIAAETMPESEAAASATTLVAPAEVITLAPPAPGEMLVVAAQAGAVYRLDFAPQGVTLEAAGDDLVLSIGADVAQGGETGGRILFEQIAQLADEGAAPLLRIAGTEISTGLLYGQAQLLAGEATEVLEAAAEAAAPGGGASAYSDDLGQVLDLLAAQGVIAPTALRFGLIELEDRLHLPAAGEAEAGRLLINEIGLGRSMDLALALGEGQVILDGPMNYVELFNDSAAAFTSEGLTVEILNPAGVVVTLALPDGLTVPAGGFLVIYQFSDPNAPSGDVYGQVFDAAGNVIEAFLLPGEAFWDLGADCSEALAVNLLNGGGGLDTFAANLELADLAALTDAGWTPADVTPADFALLFETFNGVTSAAQTLFSRVFGSESDSDSAADWTTNDDSTSGTVNDVDDGGLAGPADPNPGDGWFDDLDPQQPNQEPLAGQTVLQAGDAGALLEGFGGPDFLFGGAGSDTLYGGSAADAAAQAALNDLQEGVLPDEGFSDHNDFLAGGAGADQLYGGAGSDMLYGGYDSDHLDGGMGADILYGDNDPADAGLAGGDGDLMAGDGLNNKGNDGAGVLAMVSHGGSDSLFGGAGDDTMGGDALAASENEDVLAFARNDDSLSLSDPDGNDVLLGAAGNDLLAGEALALSGWSDANAMAVNGTDNGDPAGCDSLDGGAGDDALAGEALAISYTAMAGVGTVLGSIHGQAGGDALSGGAGTDYLAGEALVHGALGASAHTSLFAEGWSAEAGNDSIAGGSGSDRVAGEVIAQGFAAIAADLDLSALDEGRAGNDSLLGNGGDDWVAGEVLAISNGGSVEVFVLQSADSDGIVGSDLIVGGAGDDVLAGEALGSGDSTSEMTVENAADGDGAIGSDSLVGGAGHDTIAGDGLLLGGGAVWVGNQAQLGAVAAVGSDTIEAGDGDDVISGDALAMNGGTAQATETNLGEPAGNDLLDGGDGDDTIAGDALAVGGTASVHHGSEDTIFGGAGNDVISGDALVVGLGTVEITSLGGSDLILGGEGDDSIYGDANVSLTNGGYDTIDGGAGNDLIFGNGGWDEIDGGDGDDTIDGGAGFDTLAGGDGDDVLRGEDGSDDLQGGTGHDMLNGGGGNDTLRGGVGDDILHGHGDDDFVVGGDGHDFITGGDGSDSLLGGLGNDTLRGGQGADTLVGDAGTDIFAFTSDAAGGTDTILDFNTGDGDVIDLTSLLEGVIDGTDAAELDGYIDFSVSVEGTTMHIDANGAAPGGGSVQIMLAGYFNVDSDQNVIQDLLNGGNLAA